MIELGGKVVLVTGGARGIGAAIVRTVALAGADVVLHDVVTSGGAAEVQRELGATRCHLVGGDLADGRAVGAVWRSAVTWRDRMR